MKPRIVPPPAPSAPDPIAPRRALRVHPAERESRNEELRHTQDILATARDRYQGLYDFAPVDHGRARTTVRLPVPRAGGRGLSKVPG